MKINKIKITYMETEQKRICYLTEKQSKYFGLDSEKDFIIIKVGLIDITLKKLILKDKNINSNKLYLSKDIEKYIYLPKGITLQIKSLNQEVLEIGPLIGIFINNTKINDLSRGKFLTEYLDFASNCKNMYGLCYFFSINNIDWDNNLVKAIFKHNLNWITKTLPLPEIIYDQNHNINCRKESATLRERLNHKCKILNAVAKLPKWETINILKKDSTLLDLIPKTRLYTCYKDVEIILEKYTTVYLKPNSLSKGQGIFKISRIPDNYYKIEYRTKSRNHIATLKTLDNLDNLLIKYSNKGGGYIIQQEIEKASFKDNPFDIRLLYQKDYSKTWQVSGIVARIAAPFSIITSPRSGGTVMDFNKILKEVFNEDTFTKDGIYENLINFGRKICLCIENEFGTFLELGLDMAIDSKNKIWLIEVNGKPLKVSLKALKNTKINFIFNYRPIEYAVSLTNFQTSGI